MKAGLDPGLQFCWGGERLVLRAWRQNVFDRRPVLNLGLQRLAK